jgi:hypothetical protein
VNYLYSHAKQSPVAADLGRAATNREMSQATPVQAEEYAPVDGANNVTYLDERRRQRTGQAVVSVLSPTQEGSQDVQAVA